MTYIYQELTEAAMLDLVRKQGRLEQFGVEGWCALFAYMESLAQDTGTPWQWDTIALCCDFTRYESIKEYNDSEGEEYDDLLDLESRESIIRIDGDDDAFIVQNS